MTNATLAARPANRGDHLYLVLPAEVDPRLVRRLRGTLESQPGLTRLTLDAGHARRIDPVGAALLWLLCRDVQVRQHLEIEISGVSPELLVQLRSHPLQRFIATEEEIFRDPFRGMIDSTR
jgi:ABC-type transporter Mla MlaB component